MVGQEEFNAPPLVADRKLDLQIVPIETFVQEDSHVFSLAEIEQVNSSDKDVLTVVTTGTIQQSFLNQLPNTDVKFYRSSFAYLDDAQSSSPTFFLNGNFYLNLEEGAKNLHPDRRLINLPLKKSAPENYSITAIGPYQYNEKLLGLATEGTVVAINSKDPEIPTRIIYFGDYNPFNSGANPQQEGSESSSARLEGYLIDDLDEENKEFDKLHFLGPAGDYMTYIRCGTNKCDVYYTEILLGQLYVGFLYTLNETGEEVDFCPIKIQGSAL